MLTSIIAYLESVVLPLGAPGVFLASIIEEVIAIIPSPIVQMGAGFLFLGGEPVSPASLTTLVVVVMVPAAFGVAFGSLPIYYAAYYGGKPIIERFGKFVSVTWRDVEDAQERFAATSREELFIFICRSLPILPSVVISAFSGTVRLSIRTYLIYSFLGTLVRAAILGVLGWQLGALYHTYATHVDRLEKVGLVIFAFGICYFFYRARTKKV